MCLKRAFEVIKVISFFFNIIRYHVFNSHEIIIHQNRTKNHNGMGTKNKSLPSWEKFDKNFNEKCNQLLGTTLVIET